MIPEILQRDNDLRPVRYLQIALLGRALGRASASGRRGRRRRRGRHRISRRARAAADELARAQDARARRGLLRHLRRRRRSRRRSQGDEGLSLPAAAAVRQRRRARLRDRRSLTPHEFRHASSRSSAICVCSSKRASSIRPSGRPPTSSSIRAADRKKSPFATTTSRRCCPTASIPAKEVSSLFYGTDTLKGSSGAPVCSDQWYVVALHRGGVPATTVVDGRRVPVRHDGTPALAERSRRSGPLHHQRRHPRQPHLCVAPRQAGRRAARRRRAGTPRRRLARSAHWARSTCAPRRSSCRPLRRRRRAPSKRSSAATSPSSRTPRATGPRFWARTSAFRCPSLTSEVERELAPLKDSTQDRAQVRSLQPDDQPRTQNRLLRRRQYQRAPSSGTRRWTARGPPRPQWSFDPRMREEFQPDDVIFSTAMQRGHLYKREDAMWGSDAPTPRSAPTSTRSPSPTPRR